MLSIKTNKTTNTMLNKRYSVPIRTLQNWFKKEQDITSWNGKIYNQLKIYNLLENTSLLEIKKLFKKEELKILIASLNGTMYTLDLIRDGFLEMYLKDVLLYEPYNITQFLNKEDNVEIYINATISKIKTLKCFERYVLVEFCMNFWKLGIRNLEDYVK